MVSTSMGAEKVTEIGRSALKIPVSLSGTERVIRGCSREIGISVISRTSA